ncbi:hypothetical protein Q5752_003054 [Cryptotrichosporon argae]
MTRRRRLVRGIYIARPSRRTRSLIPSLETSRLLVARRQLLRLCYRAFAYCFRPDGHIMLPLALLCLGLASFRPAVAEGGHGHRHAASQSSSATVSSPASPASAADLSAGTGASSPSSTSSAVTSPAAAAAPTSSSVVTSAVAITQVTTTETTSATAAVATPQYVRPPVPTNWVWNNPANVLPDANWDIYAAMTTREYWWDISYAGGAPDGFPRRMTVVNGQYPGPLIEANTGDRIIVHVTNSIDEGQAIHWHGQLQNGTQYMDGVPGMTQCLIPPGSTFTYDFYLDAQQYGTYWWHSHQSNTMADGLVGAFIVHSSDEPAFQNVAYDEERIIFLQDWMHDQSDTIVSALVQDGGYYGSVAAPEGDAVLINGLGSGNCSLVHVPSECTDDLHASLAVPPNKKIRFRIINTSSHHMLRLSIDGHAFDVVEADGTTVSGATQVHEVPIAPAQRYSLIVDTSGGAAGDAFWIRARTAVECIAGGWVEDATAALRYVGPGQEAGTSLPTTSAWGDLLDPLLEPCVDLDHYSSLYSVKVAGPPTDTIASIAFSSTFGTFVNSTGVTFLGFGMNNVSWKNTINSPLLQEIENGGSLDPANVASVTFPDIGGADIVINNIGGPSHPFHLHGRKFWIVARGSGNIMANDIAGLSLNVTDAPLARDTLTIDANAYAVLRLVTDTPGVWGLHCHIGWHLAAGKLAAVVVQPAAVMQIARPADWQQLCYGTDPNAYGPDRKRAYPPQARAALPPDFAW